MAVGKLWQPIPLLLVCLCNPRHLSCWPTSMTRQECLFWQTEANYKPSFSVTILITRSWAWREWSADSVQPSCTTHGQKHPEVSVASEIRTDRDISAINMHQVKAWWDCSPHTLEVKQELETCDSKGSTANKWRVNTDNGRSNRHSALSMHQAGFEAFYGY